MFCSDISIMQYMAGIPRVPCVDRIWNPQAYCSLLRILYRAIIDIATVCYRVDQIID